MRLTRSVLYVPVLAVVLATAGVALASGVSPVALDAPGMGFTTGPELIADSQVAPQYPPAARAARIEGSVVLGAVINADGSVGQVTVLDSNHPRVGFEQAAEHAIRAWRFQPAEQDGEAVTSYTVLRMHFRSPSNRPYVAGGFLNIAGIGNGIAPDGVKVAAPHSMTPPPVSGPQETNRDVFRKRDLPPTSGLYDRRLLNQTYRFVPFPIVRQETN